MQAVEGLLAISDYQRRRVFNRVRPTARQLNRLRTRRRRDGGMSPSSGGTMSPGRGPVGSWFRDSRVCTRPAAPLLWFVCFAV